MTRKRIACTIERIELLINMNIVGRAEVTLIKKIETWEGRRVWRHKKIVKTNTLVPTLPRPPCLSWSKQAEDVSQISTLGNHVK